MYPSGDVPASDGSPGGVRLPWCGVERAGGLVAGRGTTRRQAGRAHLRRRLHGLRGCRLSTARRAGLDSHGFSAHGEGWGKCRLGCRTGPPGATAVVLAGGSGTGRPRCGDGRPWRQPRRPDRAAAGRCPARGGGIAASHRGSHWPSCHKLRRALRTNESRHPGRDPLSLPLGCKHRAGSCAGRGPCSAICSLKGDVP
jgi:hypothetical protein